MLSAYIGESGLHIRCESPGNVITEPEWIAVMIEGQRYQSPLAYMMKTINSTKEVFEWSEEFNVSTLQNRVVYSGNLGNRNPFMELEFKEIRCEDSGRYTCLLNGLDKWGNITQFSTSGDFVVKCKCSQCLSYYVALLYNTISIMFMRVHTPSQDLERMPLIKTDQKILIFDLSKENLNIKEWDWAFLFHCEQQAIKN